MLCIINVNLSTAYFHVLQACQYASASICFYALNYFLGAGDALESVLQKLPLYRILDDGVKGIFRLDLLPKNALREILEANGIKSKKAKSQMVKQLQTELTPQKLVRNSLIAWNASLFLLTYSYFKTEL